MRRRRRLHKISLPEISLTPLIDTALTLLVIFMITAPMVQNIKVDLPHGESKEVGAQQEFVVSINKNGKLFFNSYPISRASLVETVKKAMKDRIDAPVYIRGDKEVSYGNVIEIVDTLKMAGVKYVAMATKASARGLSERA